MSAGRKNAESTKGPAAHAAGYDRNQGIWVYPERISGGKSCFALVGGLEPWLGWRLILIP